MTTATGSGSKVFAFGDPNLYVIVDRIGMDMEVVSNLLGSNFRPTGQRGIVAYWRNTANLLPAGSWRILTIP
jgi:HK97 family phage major capsid protein